jgi:hypothetical protein
MKNCDVEEFFEEPDAMLRVPYECVEWGGLGSGNGDPSARPFDRGSVFSSD